MAEPPPQEINEVSGSDWEKTPESVKQLVSQLVLRIEQLERGLEGLRQENELLKERLKGNSQNSSRPPSEDKYKKGFKTKPKEKSERKRGGQEGHKGTSQALYPPEECERIEEHHPQECHACGDVLRGEDPEPYRVQVVEVPPIRPVVVEHRFHALSCERCGAVTRGWDDEVLNQSRYGERLSALVGWLSGVGHLSHQQVQALLSEVFNIELSTGGLNRIRKELCSALGDSVTEAGEYVQTQASVNVDETTFPQGNSDGANAKKSKGWLWVVVTPWVSYFTVVLSRAQAVAQSLLGEAFGGVVGSDRCGAYSWIDPQQRQVCWAHLKRDFTQIAERTGVSAPLGQALLEQQKLLFKLWYQVRDGTLTRAEFITQVQPIRTQVKTLLEEGAAYDIGPREKTPLAKTVRTCKMMLTVEPAFWTFVTTEGVEPTNNSAERALRPVVLWRKLSFGSQSAQGSLFVARMMTAVSSLKAQQRPVLDFLSQAIRASRSGLPSPSFLPTPTSTP